ncbi:MAG: hypothetical protein PPHEMADM_4869 [uncultured Paraburkholderia sp.]|nr:MAG: hypothetical protein PPHEMADE_4858 [uncultured Paraburkholderia sp.]CAH2940638.1 MAG: hypothetical protein PPHEMADM_4869 [uncultured Paraburkholderia sp.]
MIVSRKAALCVLGLFLSSAAYAVPMDFNYNSAAEYADSIVRLRKQVSSNLENVPNLRVTNQTPHEQLTILNFTNASADRVSLVMWNENLYVVGFIAGGTFYRFRDPEFSHITVPGTNQTDLHILSHYRDLTRVADQVRSEITISESALDNAIRNLARYGNGSVTLQQVARAMLILITSTSEAARFAELSRLIVTNLNVPSSEARSLGTYFTTLTNNWGSLSEYANRMSVDASSTADYYDRIVNAVSRNALYGILAVALYCRPSQLSSKANVASNSPGSCPNYSTIKLINNRYWEAATLAGIVRIVGGE